jgi:hypothetical protein
LSHLGIAIRAPRFGFLLDLLKQMGFDALARMREILRIG